MKSDRKTRKSAKHYFRACHRPDGSLDEQKVRAVFNALAAEKPRHYLSLMSRIHRLVEMAVHEKAVVVESATPLADRGASIFGDLEKQYGAASSTSYSENPGLLGGLRVRRGSTIWDGSLSDRLARLQQSFS